MFRFAVTYEKCGAMTPKAIPQIIKTTSSQYNSHRFPAGGFLQVAVSEAPAHNGLKARLFTRGRFRYSTKTSGQLPEATSTGRAFLVNLNER
jgi:hypothetical protein